VLVSSVVPYMLKTDNNPDGVPQEVFNGMAEDILADRARFFAGFFKDFYGIGLVSQPVSNEVVEWSRAVSMQAGLRGVLECAKSFSSTDFRPDLAAFTMPTLIIHGTDDATVPIDPCGRAAARGIAGSILHEIDGGPHGLLASHKQQISGELIAFLRGD
jgi:non-heme chloroperoxidase